MSQASPSGLRGKGEIMWKVYGLDLKCPVGMVLRRSRGGASA